MARRIAFINEKGGTGKTTLAVNVAAYLAQKKKRRVLLVDLDTQGHAGKSLGVDVRRVEKTIFHLLTEASVTVDDVVQQTAIDTLQIVPAYKEMAEFPTVVATDPDRGRRLERRLVQAAGDRWDYLVFDAPPSMGLVTLNVLLAAKEVVIPVATTYLSLDGCAEMLDTVRRVNREHAHPELAVSLVVPTMYRKTQLADEILAKLELYFPKKVTEPLHLNVAIDEAQSFGRTIWEHAPWSRGATMLQAIAETLDKRR